MGRRRAGQASPPAACVAPPALDSPTPLAAGCPLSLGTAVLQCGLARSSRPGLAPSGPRWAARGNGSAGGGLEPSWSSAERQNPTVEQAWAPAPPPPPLLPRSRPQTRRLHYPLPPKTSLPPRAALCRLRAAEEADQGCAPSAGGRWTGQQISPHARPLFTAATPPPAPQPQQESAGRGLELGRLLDARKAIFQVRRSWHSDSALPGLHARRRRLPRARPAPSATAAGTAATRKFKPCFCSDTLPPNASYRKPNRTPGPAGCRGAQDTGLLPAPVRRPAAGARRALPGCVPCRAVLWLLALLPLATRFLLPPAGGGRRCGRSRGGGCGGGRAPARHTAPAPPLAGPRR